MRPTPRTLASRSSSSTTAVRSAAGLTRARRLAHLWILCGAMGAVACSRCRPAPAAVSAPVDDTAALVELDVFPDDVLHAAQDGVSAASQAAAGLDAEGVLRDRLAAALASEPAEVEAALQALEPVATNDASRRLIIDALVALGQWDEAADRAWQWAAAAPATDRPTWIRTWYAVHQRAPGFWAAAPLDLARSPQLTRILRLGGGTSITMKFRMGETNVAAFKPMQNRYQSSYRSEIAAFRLCALIRCGIDVPVNTEVRVPRDELLDLYGMSAGAFDETYADLIWFRDAEEARWLHGTRKEWIPRFAPFAIESQSVWEPLVDPVRGADRASRTTREALLEAFLGFDGSLNERDLEGSEDLTVDALTAMISNLMVWDFLLNNWDRFSYPHTGGNCHWANGRFISIDNGAAFPKPGSYRNPLVRVRDHLEASGRFVRSTIDAIRWMDREALYPILFPENGNHPEDAAKFEEFWARRQMLLDHVDKMIAEHGEAVVYSLPEIALPLSAYFEAPPAVPSEPAPSEPAPTGVPAPAEGSR